MSEPQQLCTFYVDGLFFGIDVLQVQEIIKFQDMTRVPLSSKVVEGLINLRGQIVTAIDLRRRLHLTRRPDDSLPTNVVVRTADGAVSFLVDEIGDVIEVDSQDRESPPETMPKTARPLVNGVYKLKERLLLVLDTERTADLADPATTTPFESSPNPTFSRN